MYTKTLLLYVSSFSPTFQRKLELECRMEEEKLRLESEKGGLQKEKASLQTKLKQTIEHSQCYMALYNLNTKIS